MNINQISTLNFNARIPKTRNFMFRVPGKDGTTLVTSVTEIPTRTKNDITNINYKIMQKGKVIEEKTYQNKKGFNDERLGAICEKIQQKVKEGFDFLSELLSAQFKN